ncbi:MAG: DUF2399 domain-containing protein [Clostridiales bacterium]|nr:DUF2399 domain-containing protein [Clostridiales bacterium]
MGINRYHKKILDKLLDKYENSKTFTGDNKVNQKFSYQIEKIFPEYADESKYEAFVMINDAIKDLQEQNFIIAKLHRNSVYKTVTLNTENLLKIYELLNRKPKRDIHDELITVLEHYRLDDSPLSLYAELQLKKIKENKVVEYFIGDIKEYKDLLKAVKYSCKNEEEIFIRDFSIKIFGDSKRFEELSPKIKSLLFEYGHFPEKEMILEELNIIKTPTYVAMKGSAEIYFGTQKLDLSLMQGDISVSSITLNDIAGVKVTGDKVITVENLTSFHTMKNLNEVEKEHAFIIYLGGFHNAIRREFIKKIYNENPDCQYYHFGDIDVGGFYIYEHLKRKTGVPFKRYKMDIEILEKHKELWKPLTVNDKKRIKDLMKINESADYRDVLKFMLENECKMEQEGVMK